MSAENPTAAEGTIEAAKAKVADAEREIIRARARLTEAINAAAAAHNELNEARDRVRAEALRETRRRVRFELEREALRKRVERSRNNMGEA